MIGTHGTYRDTHNTFTQISSECGIPGFLIFVAGIVSTWLLLNAVYREAQQRPDCGDIALAVLCMMVGMVGFVVAITFLTFGYFFYLPAMGGFAFSSGLKRAGAWGYRGSNRGQGRDAKQRVLAFTCSRPAVVDSTPGVQAQSQVSG